MADERAGLDASVEHRDEDHGRLFLPVDIVRHLVHSHGRSLDEFAEHDRPALVARHADLHPTSWSAHDPGAGPFGLTCPECGNLLYEVEGATQNMPGRSRCGTCVAKAQGHLPRHEPGDAVHVKLAKVRAHLASVKNEDGLTAWTDAGVRVVANALTDDVVFLLDLIDRRAASSAVAGDRARLASKVADALQRYVQRHRRYPDRDEQFAVVLSALTAHDAQGGGRG